MQEQQLLLSDARGIYIPRDFADFDIAKSHLKKGDLEILSDPKISITGIHGKKF